MGICFVGDQPYPPLLGPARGKRWKSSHKVKQIWSILWFALNVPAELTTSNTSLIKSGSKTVVDTRTDQSRMVNGFIPGSIRSLTIIVILMICTITTFDHKNFNRAGEFGQEGPSDLDISSVVFLVDQPKVLQLLTLTLILHSLNL